MRRSVLAVMAGVALGLAPLAVPAGAAQRTHVVAHCTDVSYKPSHYIFFCADGGAGLRHAEYDSWTTDEARGSGRYYFNDCDPSCAGGTVHHRDATFRLYRVRDTAKHGPLFTRIRVMTTAKDYVYHLTKRPFPS